jgi:Na+/H+ antiporter NhaC
MKERRTWGLLVVLLLITAIIELLRLPVAAIWPSIAALIWVFATRQVLAGLFGGALIGTILLADGRLWEVPLKLVEVHLLPNFQSPWKSGAIIFTLILGGFVHLLEQGGALQAFLKRLLHGESRRKVESGAGLFGLVCFFDGLANSLMVGRIFQPMAEKSGVKKVRLAYIVDTTSAAVACLAFISTWIAYQLAMIREGFVLAGQESLANPYQLFFASLPHNYYAWFALFLMAIVIWRQWDIGPMRSFQEKAVEPSPEMAVDEEAPGLWRAWIPVSALLMIIFVGIYFDGCSRMEANPFPLSWEKLALSFAEANVPAILVFGSASGAFLAWLFFPIRSGSEMPGKVFMEGMLELFKPVMILVMAWMLSSTLKDLGAADYLGDLLGGEIPAKLFPLMVFLIGSLVAFTTGTSWGTMGLLMPLAIPIAFSVNPGDPGGAMALMPMVVGAVFSGAVFGDHCSPFSDTTIVSAIACGIEPIDHVRTQIPYAMIAAAGAAVLGFLIVGLLGGSALISPVSGALFIAFIILLTGFSRGNSTKA